MTSGTTRHRALRGLALFAAAGLLASACSSTGVALTSSSPTTPAESSSTTVGPAPEVALAASVTDGATVGVDTAVSVTATAGTLSKVALASKGTFKENQGAVPGTLSQDRSTWTAGRFLDPARTYTLTMTGANADGIAKTSTLTFKTKTLGIGQQAVVYPVPGNGSTVGVAMPVIMQFDLPVKDKAAFEKRMVVTSVPAQRGSWRWISSKEVHWRPAGYWKPGTKVSLKAALNGVPAGGGIYGMSDRSATFTVGRLFVMKADLKKTHSLRVYAKGKLVRTIPVSGGRSSNQSRSGNKVIMSKAYHVVMDAATLNIPKNDPDYYRLDVYYAMRETWSGEFLHAAPWSVGSQGRTNVSHGCIGMSTSNARWLYENVLVGDPVNVTGTSRHLEEGNGWTDWNTSYEQFKKGSALA
ncbi:MAG TPA: Ig-like domain-containing protein [Candidatus Lustribacter sp.]|nr:Ig-like domain-containing protein [Candidatus Lustribacter sp.]